MKNNRQYSLGLTLTGIGLLLIAAGILSLTRTTSYKAQVRIRLVSEETKVRKTPPLGVVYCDMFDGESNAIHSEAVLSRVIEVLDLSSKWGKRFADSKSLRLSDDIIALLRRRVEISCTPNAYIAEVSVRSEDPQEAATIANSVAEVYRDWRCDQGRKLAERGMAELAKQREKINQQIKNSEGELERLRRALNIPSPEPGIGFLRTNFPAYSKAKTELDELKNFGRLIARKIKIEQEDLSLPHHDSQVVILERAVPSATPIRFYRQSGATLLLVGLAIFGWGVAIVRNSKACDS